jgi:hypothetical protein
MGNCTSCSASNTACATCCTNCGTFCANECTVIGADAQALAQKEAPVIESAAKTIVEKTIDTVTTAATNEGSVLVNKLGDVVNKGLDDLNNKMGVPNSTPVVSEPMTN